MSRLRLLADECPTRQHAQCLVLHDQGADIEVEDGSNDEPAWGADPFDIVAHREELGYQDHD